MLVTVFSRVVTGFLTTVIAMSRATVTGFVDSTGMSWELLRHNLHEFVTGNELYKRHLYLDNYTNVN